MLKIGITGRFAWVAALGVVIVLPDLAGARAAEPCKKVIIEAQAAAGQEWKVPMGEGWWFRVVPIPPLHAAYSGWDLVVDRDQPAGFPDALYLATPPYNSINQREIGTTYGLRAQDAIGWNPRSFRFMTDPAAFHEAQQLYRSIFENGAPQPAAQSPSASGAMARLLDLEKNGSPGELRILDAHLSPGISDSQPFAQSWAIGAARTPHETVPPPGGHSTPLGTLNWMRFSLTLWLPAAWALPPELHGTGSVCGQ